MRDRGRKGKEKVQEAMDREERIKVQKEMDREERGEKTIAKRKFRGRVNI